jgi:hypothetical protein
MTDRPERSEGIVRPFVVGMVALVLVSVALAPVVASGYCWSAPTAEASGCVIEQRSLLGAAAPWWLWLLAEIIVIAATAAVVRRRLRGRGQRATPADGTGEPRT